MRLFDKVLVAGLIAMIPCLIWASSYYIDYDNGSDKNNGNSKESAWCFDSVAVLNNTFVMNPVQGDIGIIVGQCDTGKRVFVKKHL